MPILSHHSLHLPSIWSLLDVLIKMIIDSLKCYFWNVVLIVNPHFVTMKNWNWNQNTLLIVDHDLLVSIFEIFHFKSIHSLILLLWMLHLTFVFEACTFDLVALKLDFTSTPTIFSSSNHVVLCLLMIEKFVDHF